MKELAVTSKVPITKVPQNRAQRASLIVWLEREAANR
jgi:hypothetical protein